MIKYEIEGETNLPFKLSNIMVISTADGISSEKTENTDELEIVQSNDIYLVIEKNEDYNKQEMLKNVSIENITVLSRPMKGNVVFYRPNNEGQLVYDYKEDLLIENSIKYTAAATTDLRTLSVSNQGGRIGFRTCIKDITTYKPEDTAEEQTTTGLNNDSALLQKAQISINEIKYNVGFDIILELADGKKYKGYVNTTLPIEDIDKERVSGVEMVNVEKVIFKRVKF